MKKLLMIPAVLMAAAFGAEYRGAFSTMLAWDPYSDTNAVSLKLIVQSDQSTNVYAITNLSQTVLTIPTDVGVTYRARMVAVGRYGIESDPSNELTWTNPAKPATPASPRIALITFVP